MPIKELLGATDFFLEPMVLVSRDGIIETPNQSFAEQLELPVESLPGRRLDTLAAASASAVQEYLRACTESVRAVEGSLLLRRRAETIALQARGVAYPPNSAPTASHVLLQLVSQKQGPVSSSTRSRSARNAENWYEIEQSLRRQSQILEVTLASIGDAVLVTDAQGHITFTNSVASGLTEWPLEQAKGRPLTEVFPIINEHTRKPVENPVSKVLQTGTIVGLANHTMLISRSGREIPIDDSAAPIRLPDGTLFGVVLVFRDITEQRRAEHARAWLAAIVESSDDAIVSKTLNGQITSWNPGATRLFGYAPEEIIGKSITTIIPTELHAEEADVLARLRRGERVDHFETVRVAKDGRRVEISLTVSPIRNEQGEIIGASKIAREITERKRAERMLLEADQRKDEFLATLAHELRHPLAPIYNSAQLLCRIEHDRPELKNACEILQRQLQQLTRLVDDLADVSRIRAGRIDLQTEPIDLGRLLRSLELSMRPLFEASGQLLTLQADPVYVHGDSSRLFQVFSNVLHNANKYTPAGGQVCVTCERAGAEVIIRIRDTGIGIPTDMLDEVFDPMVQVHRAGLGPRGGLGLGLSVARRLIELHGGRIEAHSDGEGKGSEFLIFLAASEEPEPARGS
jgi:PAS domain S-box-containing protein